MKNIVARALAAVTFSAMASHCPSLTMAVATAAPPAQSVAARSDDPLSVLAEPPAFNEYGLIR